MKHTLFLLVLVITACSTDKNDQTENIPILSGVKWYKGNTHTHTILCNHADSHPDTVARWYLDRDYNFIILSEHNQFIDPNSVNLPADRRKDFILIPGEEVTDHSHVHTTAMNIDELVPGEYPSDQVLAENAHIGDLKVYLMQKHVDSIRGVSGTPILNHPNFVTGMAASQIQQVERLHMIELYNGHPDVHNWGTEVHASMEVKWDSLLTAGRKIYGVSSDDAHYFKDWGTNYSNPGRGWVMVQSDSLSGEAITAAMSNGKFYASSGVILSVVNASVSSYEVVVDTVATKEAIGSPYVVGHRVETSSPGFLIQFIADRGEVVKEVDGVTAKMEIPAGVIYLRIKITFSREKGGGSEQFYAWTQPVFRKY